MDFKACVSACGTVLMQNPRAATADSAEPLLRQVCLSRRVVKRTCSDLGLTIRTGAQDASAGDGPHTAQNQRAGNVVGMALYASSSIFLTVQLSCAHFLGKSPAIRTQSAICNDAQYRPIARQSISQCSAAQGGTARRYFLSLLLGRQLSPPLLA